MDPRKVYLGSVYRAERAILVAACADYRAGRGRCKAVEFDGARRAMAGLRRAFWARGNKPYRAL